jgi:hypothetical protein
MSNLCGNRIKTRAHRVAFAPMPERQLLLVHRGSARNLFPRARRSIES